MWKLTPTYEQAAGELLHEAGLTDRIERRVMDFAVSAGEVEAADVVVMNRVICCYPDMATLATAAAVHARRALVMSFPNSRWWTRLGLTAVNFGFRLFRVQFRVFLHQPELILAAAGERGLKASLNHRGLVWQVVVLTRSVI